MEARDRIRTLSVQGLALHTQMKHTANMSSKSSDKTENCVTQFTAVAKYHKIYSQMDDLLVSHTITQESGEKSLALAHWSTVEAEEVEGQKQSCRSCAPGHQGLVLLLLITLFILFFFLFLLWFLEFLVFLVSIWWRKV